MVLSPVHCVTVLVPSLSPRLHFTHIPPARTPLSCCSPRSLACGCSPRTCMPCTVMATSTASALNRSRRLLLHARRHCARVPAAELEMHAILAGVRRGWPSCVQHAAGPRRSTRTGKDARWMNVAHDTLSGCLHARTHAPLLKMLQGDEWGDAILLTTTFLLVSNAERRRPRYGLVAVSPFRPATVPIPSLSSPAPHSRPVDLVFRPKQYSDVQRDMRTMASHALAAS